MSRVYQKMNLWIWEIVSGNWVSVAKDISNKLFSDSPHRRWRWRWNRRKTTVTVTVEQKKKTVTVTATVIIFFSRGDGYGDSDKIDRFYGCRNRPRWRVTVSPWLFYNKDSNFKLKQKRDCMRQNNRSSYKIICFPRIFQKYEFFSKVVKLRWRCYPGQFVLKYF